MDSDLVVERALRALNPPNPGPQFWAEVEASLGLRRRRGPAPWWVAAAAAVVLIIGTIVVGNSLPGADRHLPLTRPTTPANSRPSAAAEAVLDFVDALGDGDVAAARLKLGPRSETMADQLLGTAANEGYGAWSASADRTTRTIELPNHETVVVLLGTVHQEGTSQYRTDAFPVVHAESADAWFVEPWAFGDGTVDSRLEWDRDAGVVYVPPHAEEAFISVDGQAATAADIDANRAVHYNDADLVTVVAQGSDGLFVALAFKP